MALNRIGRSPLGAFYRSALGVRTRTGGNPRWLPTSRNVPGDNLGLPTPVTAMAAYDGDRLFAGRDFPDGVTGRRFVRYEHGDFWRQVGWPETTGNFTGATGYAGDLYVFNSSHTRRYDGTTFSSVPGLIGALPDGSYRGGVAYGADLAVYPATPGNHISLWNGTTRTDIGVVNGAPFAAVEFNGDLIIAGSISSVGGVSVGNIARFDGSTWHAMGTFTESLFSTPIIYSLAVHNNELYAAGLFDAVDGNPASSIARFDGSNWGQVDGGMLGDRPEIVDGTIVSAGPIVRAMLSWNGSLVVGGQFDGAGAVSTPNLVRLIGSTWSDFGTGTDGVINAMTKFDSGRIAIGGDFTSVDGVSAPRVSYWSEPETT